MCKSDELCMETPASSECDFWESAASQDADDKESPTMTWEPVQPTMVSSTYWGEASEAAAWSKDASNGAWPQAEAADWTPSYVVNDSSDGVWKPSDNTWEPYYMVNESTQGAWQPSTAKPLLEPTEATFLQPHAGEMLWASGAVAWGMAKCPECPLEFGSQAEMRRHCALSHTSRLDCPQCLDVFATSEELDLHLAIYHVQVVPKAEPKEEPADEVPEEAAEAANDDPSSSWEPVPMDSETRKALMAATSCPVCAKSFTNGFSMRRHFEMHELGTYEEVHGLTKRRPNANHRPAEFSCPACPKRFTTAFSVRRHLAVHGLDPELAPGRTASPARTSSPARTPSPATYSCDLCPRVFRQADAFNSHRAYHTNSSFPCPQCSAAYNSATDLNRHTVRAHAKRFHCPQCPRQFGYQNELTRHMFTHSELTFLCALCPATFNSTHYLNKHYQRRHRVWQPYQCVDCGQAFSTTARLELHQKTCPETAAGQRFACRACRVRFCDATNLANHLNGHRMAEERSRAAPPSQDSQDSQDSKDPKPDSVFCTDCDGEFASEARLARHCRAEHRLQEDIQGRTFSCSVCLRRFAQHRELLLHLNRHLGR